MGGIPFLRELWATQTRCHGHTHTHTHTPHPRSRHARPLGHEYRAGGRRSIYRARPRSACKGATKQPGLEDDFATFQLFRE